MAEAGDQLFAKTLSRPVALAASMVTEPIDSAPGSAGCQALVWALGVGVRRSRWLFQGSRGQWHLRALPTHAAQTDSDPGPGRGGIPKSERISCFLCVYIFLYVCLVKGPCS